MDEISRFFEDITPEDFIIETSAIQEEEPLEHDFDGFTEELLRETRLSFEVADGQMNPIAVLQSHEKRRRFTPDDDETVYMFYDRLQREAQDFPGVRLFFTSIMSQATVGERHDVSTKEGLEAAKASESLIDVINWYSECSDTGQMRFGSICIEDGQITKTYSGDTPTGASPVFKKVLGGAS